jgi:hypothetical protein
MGIRSTESTILWIFAAPGSEDALLLGSSGEPPDELFRDADCKRRRLLRSTVA